MTLMIDLTPTEQERVTAAAQQQGLAPAEFVKQLVTQNLPPFTNGAASTTGTTDSEAAENRERTSGERDPERVARVRALRGKYAHTASTSGTEELHRERARDKEKEEALLREYER